MLFKIRKYPTPKFLIVLVIVLITSVMLTSCKKKVEPYKTTGLAMGTVITQSLYGKSSKETSNQITKEINNLEDNYLSWRIKNSDVYNINNNTNKYVDIDSFTYNCIKASQSVSKKCNGVFDISIGKLTSLWNIGSENAKVPSQEEIDNALKTIGYSGVKLKDGKVSVNDGQMIDLGGVGKGAACDRIEKLLTKKNYKGAVISVGGSILLHGQNPNSDKWSVAIRNPRGNANEYCAILKLDNGCVSTSGDYERVLEKDGKKYHHILDTKTGYPAKSDIISATVVCDSGVISDALSTVCFIVGFENSKEILKEFNAQAVLIDKDFNIYVSDSLKSNINVTDNKFKLVEG